MPGSENSTNEVTARPPSNNPYEDKITPFTFVIGTLVPALIIPASQILTNSMVAPSQLPQATTVGVGIGAVAGMIVGVHSDVLCNRSAGDSTPNRFIKSAVATQALTALALANVDPDRFPGGGIETALKYLGTAGAVAAVGTLLAAAAPLYNKLRKKLTKDTPRETADTTRIAGDIEAEGELIKSTRHSHTETAPNKEGKKEKITYTQRLENPKQLQVIVILANYLLLTIFIYNFLNCLV